MLFPHITISNFRWSCMMFLTARDRELPKLITPPHDLIYDAGGDEHN